jgi:hypothetical protein
MSDKRVMSVQDAALELVALAREWSLDDFAGLQRSC